MSIPIIWPADMEDKPDDHEDVKIVSNTNKSESDTPEEHSSEPDPKPKQKVEIQESSLFDKPIEFDFPEETPSKKSNKKKYCNREIIKDGEVKKCRELKETCPHHICDHCKEQKLYTDECTHKMSHNFDKRPPKLTKQVGADHLYNLQFSCYLTMETLLARTDSKYRMDGLTQKLEEKRDAYKACLEEIYAEYGSEIDSVVSPVMTWAMLTSVDIGTSVYENQKKE